MLRLKILASVVPLAVAAVFARGELLPGPRPCIEISGTAVQLATGPWHAQLHVSFTVAISRTPSASEPAIYLSENGPADYRIFVRSKSFSARDAAALIVGAHGGHRRLQAAAL